jgi:inosine/xanthosine triphosphate pyrophosphatase family protein
MLRRKSRIVYVTSSDYKREENAVLVSKCCLADGTPVRELFDFEHRPVPIQEILHVDLQAMVSAEVVSAYSQLKVPCIVEHAGLVFAEYESASYPGGLTKPMWDTLKEKFVEETKSSGRRAIARAVVAYCDGTDVHTFVGERIGSLADQPRGAREFYWDTVFIPDDPDGKAVGLTYAEIVAAPELGLEYKVTRLSQSSLAMLRFLEYRREAGEPRLWR